MLSLTRMSKPPRRAPRQLSLRKRLFFLALTALFCLGLFVAVAEILLAAFQKEQLRLMRAELVSRRDQARRTLAGDVTKGSGTLFADHPYYGFTLRPNWSGVITLHNTTRFKSDKHGFRNESDDYFDETGDERFVIGVFGGSAVFGDGVNDESDTIAAQLERALRERGVASARVVNFGVPAWRQPQQFFLVARRIEYLDMIVTCDGFNEIVIPYWNRHAPDLDPVPADFPSISIHHALRLQRTGRLELLRYPLTRYEAAYAPDSLLARSALYTWVRYDRTHALALRLEERLNPARDAERRARFERMRDREIPETDEFARLVGVGARQWAKYQGLIDAVAAERGVPVVHFIQPFRYADADVKIQPDEDVPRQDWSYFFFWAEHPSYWYGRFREAARRHYPSEHPRDGVWFYDFSQALEGDEAYWNDWVHPSAAGVVKIADRMADRLVEAMPSSR